MSREQKDNELVLFKNDKKQSDSHPDYKGDGVVNGVNVWLSAWINTSKNGVKYMKLKTTNKDDAHKQGTQQARQAVESKPMPPPDHFDDDKDLPF